MSSWSKAPERVIDITPETEHRLGRVSSHELQGASFEPELASDPTLRLKVQSSGYGSQIPQPKPRPTREELGLDEKPTFRPNLPPDGVRERVPSTGYGKTVIYKKPPPEPEQFPFRPQTAPGRHRNARSSGYGKQLVESPKPKVEVEEPSFRPDLSLSKKYRNKVPSSGYGKTTAQSPAHHRPQTAPASGLRRSGSFNATRVQRYTLHADRTPKQERAPSPTFTLDGVRVANESAVRVKKGLHNAEPVLSYEKPKLTKLAKELREKAPSSSYGEAWTPPRGERKEIKEEPRFTVSSRDSPLGKEVPVPENPLSQSIKAKAQSSGYGPAYVPPAGERVEKAPEPRFAFGVEKKLVPEAVLPPPEPTASRDKLKEKVPSSGYGSSYTPKHVTPQLNVSLEPKWNPHGKAEKAILPLDELGLPPRSPFSENGVRSKVSVQSSTLTHSESTSSKENYEGGEGDAFEDEEEIEAY